MSLDERIRKNENELHKNKGRIVGGILEAIMGIVLIIVLPMIKSLGDYPFGLNYLWTFMIIMGIITAIYGGYKYSDLSDEAAQLRSEVQKIGQQQQQQQTVVIQTTQPVVQVPNISSISAEFVFCPQCGYKCDKDSKFCKNCGSSL